MNIKSTLLAFSATLLLSTSALAQEVCIYEIESCFDDIVEACANYPSAEVCQTPDQDSDPEPPAEVSEPGIIGLLGLGLIGLALSRRNNKS